MYGKCVLGILEMNKINYLIIQFSSLNNAFVQLEKQERVGSLIGPFKGKFLDVLSQLYWLL